MTLRLGASTLRIALAGVALATLAVVLLSCDGGDGSGPGGSPTAQPSSIFPTPEETPLSPNELRDGLIASLDAIGPNVCCVPQDVQQSLLGRCGQLVDHADRETVFRLCDAINQSFQNNDPGLLDLVVARLRTLEVE